MEGKFGGWSAGPWCRWHWWLGSRSEASALLGRSPDSPAPIWSLADSTRCFLWLWMLHANFNSRGDPAPFLICR